MIASPVLDGPSSGKLRNPAVLSAVLEGLADKKPLSSFPASHPAIDYIGRWDESRTAGWAGSGLRFDFSGPLLFLQPGDKTVATEFPTIGWSVTEGLLRKSYTARVRSNVSIRLWPPEGTTIEPLASPGLDGGALSQDVLPIASNTDGGPQETKTVEITLLDWGSLLQVKSIQTLAGHSISPTFPEGISNLPTLLFIGDSLTSGYISSPASGREDEYNGFVDAYPSQLKARLSNSLRLSAIAFPGIKLVDSPDEEGMESQWFKTHPLEDGADWDFAERDSESGPTHIFVNLGTNDDTPAKKFIETYENFLNMLKETHGRRTGDIVVLAPFGSWSQEHGRYLTKYPELGEMVQRMQEIWANEDPFQNGDFPSTPMLELAKMQLESPDPCLSRISPSPSTKSLHQLVRDQSQSSKLNESGLPMPAGPESAMTSPRPSLFVRPSSIAAVTELAKGTKARLHFADTAGWLDGREDTFDGLHPTRKGAAKIGKKLARWLAKEGFLKD